jgi:hypothetical protein
MVAATSTTTTTTTTIPSDIPHITTSIVTVADAAIASSNNHYYRWCSNKKYSCERTLQVYRGGREENRGEHKGTHLINKNSKTII